MHTPPKPLLKHLSLAYGLANLQFIRKINEGYLSHNFIVSDGEYTYVLKQHRQKGEARIREVFRIEEFFHDKGVPNIPAIKTRTGGEYINYQNHQYTLLPFVKAKKYNRKNITLPALRSAGNMLARIHLLTKNNIPKLTREKRDGWSKKKFLEKEKAVRDAIERKSRKNPLDRLALIMLNMKSRAVHANTTTYQDFKLGTPHLLHGDFHHNNIFFDRHDRVQNVFDWEKSEIGSRYFELIRAMDLICFGGTFHQRRIKNAQTFLTSYARVYPINKIIFADAFKSFILEHHHSIWLHTEHYLKNNTRIDPLFANEYKRMRLYERHFDELVKILTQIM